MKRTRMNKLALRRLSTFYARKFIIGVTAIILVAGCVRSNPEAVLLTIKRSEARLDSVTALHLLLPIKNWPGVARAYAARMQANKNFGNLKAAADDSTEQAKYQALVGDN